MAPVKLAQPLQVGSLTLRNRICVPPMVIFGLGQGDGMVTEENIRHYASIAAGGPGLIIQEATCVEASGRLSRDQLGIWSDDHIPGLRNITGAVHRENCPIFIQLHHAGVVGIGPEFLCPSPYEAQSKAGPVTGQEMTESDIQRVKDAFIQAGRRAYGAGYDGVELHGCHSFLLCQFLNRNVNRRTDAYSDGLRLIQEIYDGIRAATSPEFVIGIRMGAFEPDLEAAKVHARALAAMGMAFLDVSYGFGGEMDLTAPGDESLIPVIRGAEEIQKTVPIPVFAVDGIRTPEQAENVLEKTGVAMTDIGRSILVDPDWPKKALMGQAPGRCLDCKVCQWRIDKEKCAGRVLAKRKGTMA